MGDVFLARDRRLERRVALKVLRTSLQDDETHLRRFLQEARAASALTHPNVAIIYDVGEDHGVHFIAMEYVEGQTLADYIGTEPLAIQRSSARRCRLPKPYTRHTRAASSIGT